MINVCSLVTALCVVKRGEGGKPLEQTKHQLTLT